MEKKAMFLIFVLLVFPLISAVQVDMKSEFRQGETLILKISGNFLEPIKESEVYFYREYTKVPFEFKLLKIEGDYYIYAPTLKKISGNYSIKIKNSEYYIEGGKTSKEDIVANFLISNNSADFSVSPGVQISSNGDFSLKVQNLKDEKITITFSEEEVSAFAEQEDNQQDEKNESGKVNFFESLFGTGNKSKETGQSIIILENNNLDKITLKAGEIKEINLEFEGIPAETLKTLKLSSENFAQKVLIYVLSSKEIPINKTSNIFFEQDFFNISMPTNSSITRVLYLKNNGETTFENVTFEISDSLKNKSVLEPNLIKDFESNKTEKINLTIFSGNDSESIDGIIQAKTSDGFYAYLDINLEIIKNYIPSNGKNSTKNNATPYILTSCANLKGKICEKGKECNITAVSTLDNEKCCLGECVEKGKNVKGRIIAIAILSFLIIAYIWFYLKKYKKTKSKPDLMRVAEGKDKL